jgi:Uma2 family endonuclease
MSTQTQRYATLDDLMNFGEKAELINGRIVPIMPSGFLPGRVARRITRALEDHVAAGGKGEPIADNVGYAFDTPLLSGRQSLSPDSSFYTGPLPTNPMKFIKGHPDFAVEVRSENDYGPKPDQEYADKRRDYFFAGTSVVWDVDPVNETVTVYTSADPLSPTVFRRGDTADAEPAVPGWRLAVDALFA